MRVLFYNPIAFNVTISALGCADLAPLQTFVAVSNAFAVVRARMTVATRVPLAIIAIFICQGAATLVHGDSFVESIVLGWAIASYTVAAPFIRREESLTFARIVACWEVLNTCRVT